MDVMEDPQPEESLSETDDLEARLHYLLDLDISRTLSPGQRLLLAILRQAVVDYFGADPAERLSAALYFARSPVYQMTLRQFNLPSTLLPVGVDLGAFRRQEHMDEDFEVDSLHLQTLVRQLSGTQLKLVLTMGLLARPAVTRKICLSSGLSRSTVVTAMEQLVVQGLVERHMIKSQIAWSLPSTVQKVVGEVWGSADR